MDRIIIAASALLFISSDAFLMILLGIYCFVMTIWAYKRAKRGYKDGK